MADHHIPLSQIARDPVVRAALARGERDDGAEPVLPAPPRPPVLAGGEAKKLEAA